MADQDLKKIVTEHFDKQISISNEGKFLNICGSDINSIFLRGPYVHVEKLLEDKLKEKNVLDYCCGSGNYSIYPALKGAKVYGLDISQNSIDTAIERSKLFGVEDMCIFSKGDAENMAFENNFFDIVLSYGSLSYLNLDKSLEEVRRVLKPGGLFIIIDSLGHNPIFNANRKKNILKYAPDHYSQLKTLNIDNIKNMISNKHFSNIEIKYFDFFTVLGFAVSKVTKYPFGSSFLKVIDNFLSKIPILNKLFFKTVITTTKPISKI